MNANDSLRAYNCSENYHRFGPVFTVTDGVIALCDQFECYWFLEIIMSYQPELTSAEFQVWKLVRSRDCKAIVVCEDGNDRILVSQNIDYTDFEAHEATIWVEGNIALLPSEH